MRERRVGIAVFTVVVALLAAWPTPDTHVEPLPGSRLVLAERTDAPSTPQVDRARPATPAPRAARSTSTPKRGHAAPETATVAPAWWEETAAKAEGPKRWELVEPEMSRLDWNAEMGEVLTAVEECSAYHDAPEGSALLSQVTGLRHMFEDPAFDPNSSVGTYQIAEDATRMLRASLETVGCI